MARPGPAFLVTRRGPCVKSISRSVDKCANFALDLPDYPQNVILCWLPDRPPSSLDS